jgi:hypothetical protein
MSEALVCGFADEATAMVGIAWTLGDTGGLIVREGETASASADVADGDGGVELKLEGDGLSSEATLTAAPGVVPLPAPEGAVVPGEPAGAICRARAQVSDGGERRLDCAGHLTRWGSDPAEGAELLRHLAIPGPDRSLILVTAVRRAGVADHGDETVAAWRLDPEGGATPFGEALLSTQYDDDGLQVRAGLELWGTDPDSPPMRAAGRLERGTAVSSGPVTAAALHTSAEGTEGIGSYLIWRS